MARQLRLDGTSEPYGPPRQRSGKDPALQARLGRRDAGRARLAGTDAAHKRNFAGHDPHTSDLETDYGIGFGYSQVSGRDIPSISPHDAGTFRKFGRDREIPTFGPDAIMSMQDAVSPRRVAEIRNNPSLGNDPRFPTPERPVSIEMPLRGNNGTRSMLWNGNHRAAAHVSRPQMEMFLPVREIPDSWRMDAGESAQLDDATYKDAREERYRTSAARLQQRNPFATQHDLE